MRKFGGRLQSAARRRGGFTLLNLTARSGVVSGQFSSKVMGIEHARSSSLRFSEVAFGRNILKCILTEFYLKGKEYAT